MKKVGRMWMPLLLGVVLIAGVVGVAWAKPNARSAEQAWRVLAVPMHACASELQATDWAHYGNHTECLSGYCRFYCALDFPAAGEQAVGAVHVKRLTMYAYDSNATSSDNAQVSLTKSYPPTGGATAMAYVTTTGASPANPQAVMDTSITGNPVYRTQVPYLWVSIPMTNVWIYGVYIHYIW
jgi:hypothetical protein